MLRTGVDIVEISRIGEAVARWGDRFFNRIYTSGSSPTLGGVSHSWPGGLPPRRLS